MSNEINIINYGRNPFKYLRRKKERAEKGFCREDAFDAEVYILQLIKNMLVNYRDFMEDDEFYPDRYFHNMAEWKMTIDSLILNIQYILDYQIGSFGLDNPFLEAYANMLLKYEERDEKGYVTAIHYEKIPDNKEDNDILEHYKAEESRRRREYKQTRKETYRTLEKYLPFIFL